MARSGTSFVRTWRHWRRGRDLSVPARPTTVEDADRRFLLYGVLPLWVVPAVADWWMHKKTRIEHTSGVKESAVHALMMTEAGVPVAMGLLARINPLVLSVMGGAAVAHGATALYDVSLATAEREVRPVEQHIHSFLEVLPLSAMAFTACLPACTPTRSARRCAAGRAPATGPSCPRTGRCPRSTSPDSAR